jgi:hypothetical protein
MRPLWGRQAHPRIRESGVCRPAAPKPNEVTSALLLGSVAMRFVGYIRSVRGLHCDLNSLIDPLLSLLPGREGYFDPASVIAGSCNPDLEPGSASLYRVCVHASIYGMVSGGLKRVRWPRLAQLRPEPLQPIPRAATKFPGGRIDQPNFRQRVVPPAIITRCTRQEEVIFGCHQATSEAFEVFVAICI